MLMSTSLYANSWRFAFLFSILTIGFRSNPSSSAKSIPTPTPRPDQFNALLFTNHSLTGKVQLQMNDLWYDWPNRRTMNRIQYQLGDYLHDVEWNNGTSYYFTSGPTGTCTTRLFEVGVLPPEWLDGATYLGRTWADGFECHVYTKVDFIIYYEEVGTGRPVWWNFTDGTISYLTYFLLLFCFSFAPFTFHGNNIFASLKRLVTVVKFHAGELKYYNKYSKII